MKKNLLNISIIFAFLLCLMLPLVCTDWAGGGVLSRENRNKASFPLVVNAETGNFDMSRSSVENWINDNIGFREQFMNLYTQIKYHVFNLSTSNKVLLGRDDWLYWTFDNNIEIATGDYPLDEEVLKNIATYQQQINDYYKSMGIQYVLMLTPSKTSVYPEYLPMNDKVVDITPVDILTDYLRKNTDVIVYNAKDVLIPAKETGQLFFKNDTHWTQLGSYTAYCGLMKILRQQNILDTPPIDVTFSSMESGGDLSDMLGVSRKEITSVAEWERNSIQLSPGNEMFDRLNSVQRNYTAYDMDILENPTVNDQTLAIYGDSQMQVWRKFPAYLAEHFGRVCNFRVGPIYEAIDTETKPDVVLYSCSERYIYTLNKAAEIPVVLTTMPEFEKELIQTQGYHGMHIDTCNDQPFGYQHAPMVVSAQETEKITLRGWAFDSSQMMPLSELYLIVGEYILKCNFDMERPDVAHHFGSENLTYVGFTVSFPLRYLTEQNISQISFIHVGSDGMSCAAPVEYTIIVE